MTKPARYAQPAPKQLLARILQTPALVSAVRTLPPRALGRLIDHVGLEDSGDLVALASTEQLRQIFDDDLWRSERPGVDESFDADRFALWLEVMLEAGEEFTARKLTELPLELVLLALQRHILVINADDLSVQMADPDRDYTMMNKALDSCLYQEFGEYQVISRNHHGWDAILSVLLALDRDHHSLLRRILERCCQMSEEFIEENGGLQRVLSSEDMLETDLAADREDRRAAAGFIAPSAATSLLNLARISDPSKIVSQPRDPITRAYFRELERRAQPGKQSRPPAAEAPAEGSAADLVEVLRRAEVLPPERLPLLLEGRADQPRDALAETPLGRALAELQQKDLALHAERMEELAYLANVLLAGCSLGGRSLRPLQGAHAAVAVCNLGLEHLLSGASGKPAKADTGAATEQLTRVGADKLFLIGWRLLHDLSLSAARALERTLVRGLEGTPEEGPERERALRGVRSALKAGKPWLARRSLDALSSIMDESTASAARALVDELPTLAGALSGASGAGERDGGEVELIAGTEQLRRSTAFLEKL